jgi:diguanylate cyclase (GGDEF)-like protein
MSLQWVTLFTSAVVSVLTVSTLVGVVSHYVREKARFRERARWTHELAATNVKARTGTVTGLPNRDGLIRELAARIHHTGPWSLILLNLDGREPANDQLGRQVSDIVLTTVDQRLRTSIGDRSLIARLSDDELIVVLAEPVETVTRVMDEITAAINQSQRLQGMALNVRISTGIAGYVPEIDESDMIRRGRAPMPRQNPAPCAI